MKTYIKSFLIFIFYFLFYPLIIFLIKNLNLNIINYKSIVFITIDVIFIIILLLLYKNDLKTYFKNFKKTFKNDYEIYFRYWIIALIISTFISFLIQAFIKDSLPANEEAVRSLLISLPLYSILSTAIIAPFTEEIIFRKTLYDIMKKYKYLFIITSGLVFGFVHVGFELNEIIDVIPYSILGASFALMYVKSKNLMYPMFFHFIHNALLLISFYISYFIGR